MSNDESVDPTRDTDAPNAAGTSDEQVAGDAANAAVPAASGIVPPVDEPPTDVPPPADEPGDHTKRRRRWRWIAVAAFVVVLGGLYVGGYFLTGARMPADASVAGVDIGGLSPAAAETKLTEELAPRANQSLTLTLDEHEFTFTASDMGLALDAAASVDLAGGHRSWNPLDMVALFFGGQDHRPELDMDEQAFAGVHESIAGVVDIEVTEALITFPEAQPVAQQPADGREVTSADLLDAVRDVYLITDDPVTIPVSVVEPGVTSEELEVAMAEIAIPAVSAPVLIQVGGQQVELPVTAYAPALQVRTEGDEMAAWIDPVALADPLTDSSTGIGEQAVDADIDVEGGAVVITPSKPGIGLQPEVMATELLTVLTATGPDRSLSVEAAPVEPKFTTADAEALQIVEKVSEFETHYPNSHYRNVNQGRAAELIDGTILEPGEQFSFDEVVGKRTPQNGFVQGGVIEGGKFVNSYGGGVSQVATTLYNAAFFAGLQDDEHQAHSLYLTRYPVGREATVNWGTIDLKFTNTTPYGVLIKAWVVPSGSGRQGTMHVEMWSTKHWDIETSTSSKRNFRSGTTIYDSAPDCTPQSPIQGFDIDVYRVFKQNGQTVKTETTTTVYRAGNAIVCGPPPGSEPAP